MKKNNKINSKDKCLLNAIPLSELKSAYYFEQITSYAELILKIKFVHRGRFYNLASCPFHSDTDPSFYLYKRYGFVRFKCFSKKCKRAWDIFDLIQEIEGCDFIESVKRFGKYLHIDAVKISDRSILKID